MGRKPAKDTLGIFIPLLKELREYRLKYKSLAREASSDDMKREYQARQSAFKILINSFYGYLGFSQARFGDGELAAEVTKRGREILLHLIDKFQQEDCIVLEADTDGIYLSSDTFWEQPEALLERVTHELPEGISLEFDGRYEAMFCYKAKNYALYDGKKVVIRGSALRSRGTEPFLKALTDNLINWLLGAGGMDPALFLEEWKLKIEEGRAELPDLARSEYLSMSPAAYARKMETGGKPRRASLEVAQRLHPVPKQGEKVTYFIGPRAKGQTSDWQRAHPLADYDPVNLPYDRPYYLKKLKEWEKRYAEFLTGDS